MLSEWAIFGIFAAAVASLSLSFSYLARSKVDQDNSGSITPDEVPFLNQTLNLPVKVNGPRYWDMSILCILRVLPEAFMHSFCYGCIVVFTMNLIMSKLSMDQRYAYLMVCAMVFMACMYMCHYVTNGIHVVTSHTIHLVYYGFAFIPLAFLWNTPEKEYLVALVAIVVLGIYRLGRNIAFPNYPKVHQISRLYKYFVEEDEWKLASVPKFGSRLDGESSSIVPSSIGELPDTPPVSEGSIWAVVFPTYEIMHILISSSFTMGVVVGTATSKILGLVGFEIVSTTSLAISVLLSIPVVVAYQSYGIYGSNENKMHKIVLGKFSPKTVAVIVGMLGAAAVVIQLEPIVVGNETNIVYYAGIGALVINIILTFLLSLWAKLQHSVHATQ